MSNIEHEFEIEEFDPEAIARAFKDHDIIRRTFSHRFHCRLKGNPKTVDQLETNARAVFHEMAPDFNMDLINIDLNLPDGKVVRLVVCDV